MSKTKLIIVLTICSRIYWNLNLYSFSRRNSGGPRSRVLPPPREVIDHDNSLKSSPHVTSFEPVDHGPPADQVTSLTIPAWSRLWLICSDIYSIYIFTRFAQYA